jgi:hypothetical protein
VSQKEYEAAVAAFLQKKSVTRCPTVCAGPTHGTIAESDRVELQRYAAEREAARLAKHRGTPIPATPVAPVAR